MEKKRR
jgi:hypothetical protein